MKATEKTAVQKRQNGLTYKWINAYRIQEVSAKPPCYPDN
jgi:hypothetical protein